VAACKVPRNRPGLSDGKTHPCAVRDEAFCRVLGFSVAAHVRTEIDAHLCRAGRCDCVSYRSGPPVHYSKRITATCERCQRIIAVLVCSSIQRSRSMPVTSRRRTTREETDRRISRLSAQRNVQANLAMLRSPLLSMNVSPSRRRTIGRLSTLTSSWSTDSSGDTLTTSSSPVIVTTVSKEAVYNRMSTLDVRYRMRLALSIRTRE
jgi:hypothetical protein